MDLTLGQWLSPWEFSPTLIICFIVSGVLFFRGALVRPIHWVRHMLFWSAWFMLYLALHTHVDYFAERVFFIHRAQHVFLHHLAPLLIMAAYPVPVMKAGLPLAWRRWCRHYALNPVVSAVIALCRHKYLVPFMFVFLVLVWLIPSVQFYSMLDVHLYRLMNWSVVVSGFFYWALILDRRSAPPASMRPMGRVISPIITMIPQIIAGVYIATVSVDLYPLFDLCGRAVPISALEDQAYGGLIMWVPAAAIESFGFVAALFNSMRLNARKRR